jgi:hexulose-6-phosphate isomerase
MRGQYTFLFVTDEASMNHTQLSRRDILVASAAAAVALPQIPAKAAEVRGTLHKAMIVGPVTEKTLEPLKTAGFEGVETRYYTCGDAEAAKLKGNADRMGMRIHSVMRGWAEFNTDDPKKLLATIEETRQSMRAAKAYGADDILLVPCRIGGMPMPEAWEFKIEFDEKSGYLKRVVEGDNSKYAEYIAAHNKASDASRVAVEALIPLAEELKIIIALENVWNNLWVAPAFYKSFVSWFNHPWVKSYFDIGNHVKYAPPQDWIRELGSLVVRLHVKDFKLNADGHGGTFCHPRDGSIDWPAVRLALSDIDYNGWASIEDGGLPLAEFARRFDLIAEGK